MKYWRQLADSATIAPANPMKPAAFDYARPERLDKAIALLSERQGEAKIIAGGQSLMPMLAFRLATPSLLIDIGRIPDLNRIGIGPDGVRLGALVRWRDIERHETLAAAHPLLVEAVRHVAHYQIRNRGTVGGSLAHADPAAELPGVAVACDAEISVVGPSGPRSVAASDFFLGALTTALRPDEVIVAINFPPWPTARHWAFEEFARRKGDFAVAGVALFYDRDAEGRTCDPRIAAIGIGGAPVRLKTAEAALAARRLDIAAIRNAAAAAATGVAITGDIHAGADYRQVLLGVLLERALCRAGEIAAV